MVILHINKREKETRRHLVSSVSCFASGISRSIFSFVFCYLSQDLTPRTLAVSNGKCPRSEILDVDPPGLGGLTEPLVGGFVVGDGIEAHGFECGIALITA